MTYDFPWVACDQFLFSSFEFCNNLLYSASYCVHCISFLVLNAIFIIFKYHKSAKPLRLSNSSAHEVQPSIYTTLSHISEPRTCLSAELIYTYKHDAHLQPNTIR